MNRLAAVSLLGALLLASAGLSAADPGTDLKKQGVFGFPQNQATVLCDTQDLRVSVWNDAAYLFVQAVLWKDGDDTIGETDDGRKIGDTSSLEVDADADGKVTPKVDRCYSLNPWPSHPGLRYQVKLSANSSTPLQGDSKGRGNIAYIETVAGKVRVDSYLIPLTEIGRKTGDKVRFAYYGDSPKPVLIVNSIGFKRKGDYSSYNLPHDKYHEFTLSDRPASIDIKKVPDGRDTPVAQDRPLSKPMPKVGAVPPEVAAKDWLNTEKALTLAGLKGKVVVVDFWATWCGPCVAGIPHLNKLHDEYGPKGLVILGFTDQSKAGIARFQKATPMKYVIGTGSELSAEYGVNGIPHAFIVGKDGKLAWEGDPNSKEFDKRVLAALNAK